MKYIKIVIIIIVVGLLFFFISQSSKSKSRSVSIDVERVLFEQNSFLREYIVNVNEDTATQYLYAVNKTKDIFNLLLPSINVSSFDEFKNVLNSDITQTQFKGLYSIFGKENVDGYLNAVREQYENQLNNRTMSSIMNYEESNHHISQMILKLRKL